MPRPHRAVERSRPSPGSRRWCVPCSSTPTRPTATSSSLAAISQGGSPVPPDSIAKIEDEFAGKVAAGQRLRPHRDDLGGGGQQRGDVLRQEGQRRQAGAGVGRAGGRRDWATPLPLGSVGELWTRGPNNVRGYWNKPEETAKAFTDGWFHTGDAARLDEDGFVYVVDRIKDVVLRGGENVYSAEVEAAIFEHPDVADVAIVGVPHTSLGEEVAAVVILQARIDADHDRAAGVRRPSAWPGSRCRRSCCSARIRCRATPPARC